MSSDCIFCRITEGEVPATVIGETPLSIAFRDLAPRSPVHFLVVPRKHVRSLDEATEGQFLGDMLLLAARIAREQGVAESGYRAVINTNGDGGQTVFHLHIHVLGGRPLDWPPG